MVELSIAIVEERLVNLVGQFHGVAARGLGEAPEIIHAFAENLDHGSAAVVAAIEHRSGKSHETPHEAERFLRIGGSDVVDDCPSLCLEVFNERASVLPI